VKKKIFKIMKNLSMPDLPARSLRDSKKTNGFTKAGRTEKERANRRITNGEVALASKEHQWVSKGLREVKNVPEDNILPTRQTPKRGQQPRPAASTAK